VELCEQCSCLPSAPIAKYTEGKVKYCSCSCHGPNMEENSLLSMAIIVGFVIFFIIVLLSELHVQL
jgi:hypothetical protein